MQRMKKLGRIGASVIFSVAVAMNASYASEKTTSEPDVDAVLAENEALKAEQATLEATLEKQAAEAKQKMERIQALKQKLAQLQQAQ